MSAFAALPDPVFIFRAVRDPDGTVVELTYTYVNDAAARLYGLPVDAVLGHGQLELFPSARELGIFDAYVGVIDSGSPDTFDVPWFQENGVEGAFSLTVSRFGDGVVVLARDVTRERQLEAELRATGQQFQMLAENASDVVVLSGPDRLIDWVSPTVTRTLGWAPEDLVGTDEVDLIHPGDRAALDTIRDAVFAGQAVATPAGGFVARLRTKPGDYRWISLIPTPVTDASGAFQGVVAGWRDVDDLVHTQQVAQADRDRLRATSNSLLDPHVLLVAVRDAAGQIVDLAYGDANPAACEYLRLDYEHLVGARLLEVMPGQQGAGLLESYRHVVETGEPLVLDGVIYPLEILGGEERHYDIRGARAGDGLSLTWRDVTDQHATVQALARAEERFHGAFDDAPLGVALSDLTGRWLQVNDAFASITGFPKDQLLQMGPAGLLSSDEIAAGEEFRRDITRGVGRRTLVQQFRRADGHLGVVRVTATRLLDAAGTHTGFVSHIEDITERVSANQNIRRLAAILEHSNDAVLSKSLDGVITSWNPAAERLYGYSAAEAVGMPISFLIPPDQEDDTQEILARIARGERIENSEANRVCKDGRVIDVAISVAPIRDDAGALVGASTIARDITERKQAAASARAAQERFRIAFERAPVGMAQLDPDGRLVEVNDALCELLGYTAGQLLGRTTLELTHPNEGARRKDLYARFAAEALASHRAERCFQHADGHPVWVAESIAAITDDRSQAQHLLAHFLDISERKQIEANLAHLAVHDPLTGLLNRRGFEAELDRQAADVARYGPSGALVMVDLDHFKEVNDTLGHLTGDELIVSIAGVLNRSVRGTDIVARLGGDEFAIILPHARRDEAQAVADKILRAVRNQVTVLSGDHRRTITASVGVAMFDDPGLGGEGVLLNADLAMYAAKHAGRNRSSLYDVTSPRQAPTKTRLDWVERINMALEHDRFELHAQPVLDLHTGRVGQYELLLRMLDDDGATIGPDEFLHTAERTGLIGRIDRWVTGQAIDLLIHPDLSPETVLEVNISGLSVGDADLLTFLEEQFRQTGADPSRLVFEITETAAIGNVPAARTFAERLTDIGCQFALDDFGSGFGSFYYLKHLHFDYIKIDGEFIANCIANQTDQLVIQALVTIAHGLNKQTVAEFVGDENTLRFVADQGIDFAQGYHIGRPDVLDNLIRGNGHGTSPDWVRT